MCKQIKWHSWNDDEGKAKDDEWLGRELGSNFEVWLASEE